MSKIRIPILSFLADAIIGKNKFGKRANEWLPARKQREFVGEIIKGAGDLIPKPQAKDASIVRDAEKVKHLLADLPDDYDELNELFMESPDYVTARIYEIKDLLDDGRLNDSAEGLSPETKFKIRITSSIGLGIAVIYQIAAFFLDWPSLPFLSFIGA